MEYYPVYLNLKNKYCIVIGGNPEAEGKVAGLLRAGAKVRVIWPEVTPGLAKLAEEGKLRLCKRGYQPGDLAGAFLVISTITDEAVNAQVWAEGEASNALVNVMDDIPHCNFIAPSILRQGDLTIAISTNGKAPALAVRLRQFLEQKIGHEYGRFLSMAGAIRTPLADKYPDLHTRRQMWYQLVDSDVFDLLKEGKDTEARQRFVDIMHIEPGVLGKYEHI